MIGIDGERFEPEERLLPARRAPHEQLEGRVGGLEVIALVFEPLQGVDHIAERLAVDLNTERRRFHFQRGATRHLRDQHPSAVAHSARVDVFVGVARSTQRRCVEARFVGECRRSDIGLLGVDREVDEFSDVMRNRREVSEMPVGETSDPHLEFEVGHDRHKVAVPNPLAISVDRALHLGGAGSNRRKRIRYPTTGVVVEVDAHAAVDVRHDGRNRRLDVGRQRATVGVAQHDRFGAGHRRRLHHPKAELRVALEAVEEVLGIEEHPLALRNQILDRVGHHGDTLVERGLERLGDVVVPALADDADDLRTGRDEIGQGLITVDLALGSTRRAERNERRGRQVQFGLGPFEELVVLWVCSWPAAFDEGNAEPVELFSDPQFVVDGQRDALELAAIAQCRVVDVDCSRPGGIMNGGSVDLGHDAASSSPYRASSFQCRYLSFLPRTRSA